MAFLGNFRASRLLEQILGSDGAVGRDTTRAIEGLRSLGAASVEPILAALPNASRPVHAALVDALAGIANGKTLPLFLDALAEGSPRLVPGIVEALKGAEDLPAASLIDALRKPGIPKAPLLEVIKAKHDRIPPRELLNAAAALDGKDKAVLFRLVGEAADAGLVPDLVNRLQGRDLNARLHIIAILARFDTPEVRYALQGQLADGNKIVRSAALGALSRMEGPVDAELVCRLLCDADIEVQNRAVDVLIRSKDPETVRFLIPVLKDENEYARRSAVEVLNEVGDAGSLKYLLTALKDSDWWVRSRAGDALGKIGGPRVIQAVLELARDEDPELRRSAIEILNQTKDDIAVAQLIEATHDPDWWVSERAVDALAAIGSKRALPRLLEMLDSAGEQQLPTILRAVAAVGDGNCVDAVLPLLHRTDRAVRIESIHCLARLADGQRLDDVRLLLQALAGTGDESIFPATQEAMAELERRFSATDELSATMVDRSPSMMGRAPRGSEAPRGLLHDTNVMQAIRRVEPEQAAAPRLDISSLKPGDVLEGRYKFIKRIGKGAFGTVLLMEDEVVGESLILKFLNPGVAEDEETMQRFVHELRYSRKITHQNVIRIYDFLAIRGNYAISMEYFPSHTLGSEVASDKPLELRRAIRFGMDICTGMAVAHQAGIVHRDLKPANVLINDAGELKIVDFGVASAHREGDTQLTKTGFVIGSPKYMAPEQILGKSIDERADIYAVGVILYELLTGVPPYSEGDHMAVMYQHVQGRATPPAERNPALPAGLGEIVMKAMAVERAERFQSMDELKSALEAFA
ncbi:MAG: hypothetical protein RLZZ393_665 [Pseudomonadota bacterium]